MNAVERVPVQNGPMAAAAIVRNIVFVTRDVRDVARTDVTLLDPRDTRRSAAGQPRRYSTMTSGTS